MAENPYVIPDGMFDDVSNAQSWNLIVSCMCEGLKIPGAHVVAQTCRS